jgi:hypothetical protein
MAFRGPRDRHGNARMRAGWLALASLLVPSHSLAHPTAAAAFEACHVSLIAPISETWAQPLSQVCSALLQRNDIDGNAHLEVAPGPRHGLTLHAKLSDGRSADRYVDSRAALALTLEALLVLPQPVEEPKPATPIEHPAPPTPVMIADRPAEPATESPLTAVPLPVHVGFAATMIGRVAGAPTYVGGGFALHASLRLGATFFDVTPRWEAQQASLQMPLPDFEMHTLGIGMLLGLRAWDSPAGAIEAGGGAVLLAETQSYRVEGKELSGTLINGQLEAFARLLWGRPGLRWLVSVNANLAPQRLSREAHINAILPPLPSFGIGIGFGAHWESS